jgi:hypothetical protein
VRLFITPATILRWHRDIVRRRWASKSKPKRPGRPPTHRRIVRLVLRMAADNEHWGTGVNGVVVRTNRVHAGRQLYHARHGNRLPAAEHGSNTIEFSGASAFAPGFSGIADRQQE